MKKRHVATIWLLLFLTASAVVAQKDKGASDTLSLHDRVWTATQFYSGINTYFAHWRGIPDLDLDKEFQIYLDEILSTEDRRAFDLATMELVAKLKSGHSGFRDNWLMDNDGGMVGF